MNEIIHCPLCHSNVVLHRGSNARQCGTCGARFTIDAKGKSVNGFTQWLESRRKGKRGTRRTNERPPGRAEHSTARERSGDPLSLSPDHSSE